MVNTCCFLYKKKKKNYVKNTTRPDPTRLACFAMSLTLNLKPFRNSFFFHVYRRCNSAILIET